MPRGQTPGQASYAVVIVCGAAREICNGYNEQHAGKNLIQSANFLFYFNDDVEN